MVETNNRQVNFTLDSFRRANENMIATNESAYSDLLNRFGRYTWGEKVREYSLEDVQNIIKSGSILQQAALSRAFFVKNGFYKRLLIYFGTLLKYNGILIPNPSYGKSLQDNHISKRYYQAVDFNERLNLPLLATNFAMRALIDGTYYGVIQTMNKSDFAVLDLPHAWCRSNFKDEKGNDIVEFNVAYFDTIIDAEQRKAALTAYPKEISQYYKAWARNKGKKSSWMFIPSDIGIAFYFFDGRPLFLHIIPSTMEYDEAVSRDAEREAEEIKKIIVQKIPHLNDGSLLFEPVEAEEMHKGSVKMLRKSNPNTSVLTTYADVDAIISKSNVEGANNNQIEKMKLNIYNEAGTSAQIFAATGNLAIDVSLKNDLALAMVLWNKIGLFTTNIINRLYANTNVSFKFKPLPLSWYNEKDFIDNSYKMVNTGYSLLLPAIAMGLTQRDLVNIKELENDVLGLTDILIPPSSASTQSGGGGQVGRPTLPTDQKSEKTIRNQESEDKQGGSENEQ